MSDWIPVNDRMPEDDQHILVTDGNEILIRWGSHIYGTPDGTKEVPAHYGNGLKVIAWMPLPEPYKVEQHD